jgi:hypothetical protein
VCSSIPYIYYLLRKPCHTTDRGRADNRPGTPCVAPVTNAQASPCLGLRAHAPNPTAPNRVSRASHPKGCMCRYPPNRILCCNRKITVPKPHHCAPELNRDAMGKSSSLYQGLPTAVEKCCQDHCARICTKTLFQESLCTYWNPLAMEKITIPSGPVRPN